VAVLEWVPLRRRFTREDYYRMAEAGILRPDERVELIEGEILTMAPQGPDHASMGDRVRDLIAAALPAGFYVRSQRPLSLGQASDPEPDIAVVRGSWSDYLEAHPTTAELVVEVSRASLAFDRAAKCSLYAAAGIPDYWIINLEQRLLEVYREPMLDPVAFLGFSYARMERLEPGAAISPLAAPETILQVESLLPPRPIS
jgi:Uma2 family endonuclease